MGKNIYFKPRIIWCCKNTVLIVLLSILFIACEKRNKEVKLLFVGDILLSRNVKEELNTKNSSPWEELKLYFKSADLVIGNLEGSIGEYNLSLKLEYPPIFGIDSNDIFLLSDAGFNIITMENNHSYDYGEMGRSKTFNTLLENNITPNTLNNSPLFFNVNNTIISLIAINTVLDRDSTQESIPSIELNQKLRLAKALSEFVIVSIHWGSELLEWPNKNQREAANWLTLNGADLIIGSHSHVIQKPEMINGKPVYFSVGNHLFDQKYATTKEGLIVEVILKDGDAECRSHKTVNQKNSFFPRIEKEEDYGLKSFRYETEKFKINNFTLNPESVLSKDGSEIILSGFKDKLLWKTEPMKINTIEILSEEEDYLFMLKPHYSPLDNVEGIRPYVYSVDDYGLNAKWRGSALAWPLLDAKVVTEDSCIICALHRGDSFLMIDPNNKETRIAAYSWNGFGFDGISDTTVINECRLVFDY